MSSLWKKASSLLVQNMFYVVSIAVRLLIGFLLEIEVALNAKKRNIVLTDINVLSVVDSGV